MSITITNVAANTGPLPQCLKADGTTPVSVALNDSYTYRLTHLSITEDGTTAATMPVIVTCAVAGGTPTTVTAGLTGALGRCILKSGASVEIGPGVTGISLLALSAGNPVVQVEPILRKMS